MQDKELKHEFELERIILFSDAVFAIIITIMVLELKLPEGLKGADPEKIRHVFKELVIKFIAYLGSFFLVSSFWIRHLKIFKNLRDYDVPLVARNLLFLFVISMFPFAISTITSGMLFNSYWTVDIYIMIILSGIFAQALIIQYIVKHKQTLCTKPDTVADTLQWKAMRINFYMFPVAILLLAVLNFFNVYPPSLVYILAFYAVVIRVASKKLYPKNKALIKPKHAEHMLEPAEILP